MESLSHSTLYDAHGSPPQYSGCFQDKPSSVSDKMLTRTSRGGEGALLEGEMEYQEVAGPLQLWPLNASILHVYNFWGDKVEGVMKLVSNPPSETDLTLTTDELPMRVPPVAIVDGRPEPVSTSKKGKFPFCEVKVITQRWPYTDMESCVCENIDTETVSIVDIPSSAPLMSSASESM